MALPGFVIACVVSWMVADRHCAAAAAPAVHSIFEGVDLGTSGGMPPGSFVALILECQTDPNART